MPLEKFDDLRCNTFENQINAILSFFNKKKRYAVGHISFFMSMSYEKDIFAVFAYEFELLHNRSFLVKSFAYAHGEIIYSVNCEI